MIKTTLLSTLFFIALTPIVQAQEDFKPSNSVVTLMPIVMDNLDILDLSAKQLDEVRAISRKNFADVEYINAEYNNLKTELKEILLDSQNQNQKRATEIIDELAKLDKQRMTLTMTCAFNLKRILGTKTFEEVVSTLEFQSH
ncbi:hypothetical protein [Thiomicrorhabdus sp.]|uniref:hypothetical protein n=1 Tax=Thiomicrorhabdus sp. TaxID=2039724 RepID=UPI002AA92DFE|nr:hypothetical protein [Thiomicrorhabdus sp.]